MRRMPVPAEVKQRIIEALKTGIAKAEARYKTTIRFPHVVFEKTGTVAGTANYRTWTIDLNSGLLMRNVDEFIQRTVLHELAHLITFQVYPETWQEAQGKLTFTSNGRMRREKREIHGPRWQEVCLVIGMTDISRTHRYDVTEVKKNIDQSRFLYRCPNGHEHQISARKHAKAQRGVQYVCLQCNGRPPVSFVQVAKFAPSAYAVQQQQRQEKAGGPKAPDISTKLGRCFDLYVSYVGIPRGRMIDKFVYEADCTPAGAATYYATCKKLYEQGIR